MKLPEKTIAEKIKEVVSHTFIYGFGSVLQAILGFLFIPLYTRYYTTEMYGILSLLTLCGTLAGAVFWVGASSALSRSYYDYDDIDQRKTVVSTSLFITFSGAIIQIFLGLFLSRKISILLFDTIIYSPHITITFISSALTFINTLFYLLLRFERRSKLVVSLNLLSLLLTTFFVVYFLIYLKMGVMAPVLGIGISQAIIFIIQFYLSRKYVVLAVSKIELRLQIAFGLAQVIIALQYYSLDWIDRLMINEICSLGDVGIYSFGYKIGMLVQVLFIIPFSQIWGPMRMEYRKDANVKTLNSLMLTYYFIVGGIIAIIISTFSKELINVIGGKKEYISGYIVVPFVIFGHLFYGAINIVDYGLLIERKIIYYAYIFSMTIIINVVFNIIFIPKLGYIAAAYSTLLSYFITSVLVYKVSNKYFKIDCEIERLFKLFVACIIVMFATYGIINYSLGDAIIMKAGLISLFLAYTFLFILKKDERQKVYCFVKGEI